jgi:hypothetical protein
MKTSHWIKLLKKVGSKRSIEMEGKEGLKIMFTVAIRSMKKVEMILGKKEGKDLIVNLRIIGSIRSIGKSS